MSSTSSGMELCFNSTCKQPLNKFAPEFQRRGWRRRSGDYADLCHRCGSVYEEGKFCETFHINASGWRCCESCGKQIHCGCIVSFHMFVLLDAGGIECITCARKSFILTPNPAWPPPPSFPAPQVERAKDLSSRNWCPIAGSGPVPWRQASRYFVSSCAQPDLQSRAPMEIDIKGGFQRLASSGAFSLGSFDKNNMDVSQRINGMLKLGSSEKRDTGTPGNNSAEHANLRVPLQPSFFKKDTPNVNFPSYSARRNEIKDSTVASSTLVSQPIPPHVNGKLSSGQCGTESSVLVQKHNRSPSGYTGLPNRPFPRQLPKASNQELPQIPEPSKMVTTPLFEKILSVSDAGNLGRLILPKRCAEAYFPPISKPEGLSIKLLDLKGKEWTFQFRFWPNNNSRMYVLEGVYQCMQSMNLQAGDIVTFERIEPQGKLLIGYRKANASPSTEDARLGNAGDRSAKAGDDSESKTRHGEGSSSYLGSVSKSKLAAQASQDKDKKVDTVKEFQGPKSSVINKRKNIPGSTSEGVRVENDDSKKLKLTVEQAQGLFRAPLSRNPGVVEVEGFDFEEFEDAPVIGRPTIFLMERTGRNVQLVQCEDCLKWRKVPGDASLSFRWTCSANSWDPERSSCGAAQELTAEQLEELVPRSIQTASENTSGVNQEPGPDKRAGPVYMAIPDEGNAGMSSSQATQKHPRHRPGCVCIVCIQPPRGEGPRHEPTCRCNFCLSTKRRTQTLMSRRENKQSEKVAEKLPGHRSSLDGGKQSTAGGVGMNGGTQSTVGGIGSNGVIQSTVHAIGSNVGINLNVEQKDDGVNFNRSSPFKGLDLNIQPEEMTS